MSSIMAVTASQRLMSQKDRGKSMSLSLRYCLAKIHKRELHGKHMRDCHDLIPRTL